MKQQEKGAGTKKGGDAEVRKYIAALPADHRKIAQRFDELVAREVSTVRRVIKWGMPFYGVPGRGWFVSCGGFKTCVKITFFQGLALKPVPPVGTSPKVRSADVPTLAEFDDKQITSWVRQASKMPGFGS